MKSVFRFCRKMKSVFRILEVWEVRNLISRAFLFRFFVAIRSVFRILTKNEIRCSIATKSGIRFSIWLRYGLWATMGLRAAGWLHERLPLGPGRPFSAEACPAAHDFKCCLYQFGAQQIHPSRVFCLSPCSRPAFQRVLLVKIRLARKPRGRQALCH